MTDTSRRTRVQAGVPTGGEFAVEAKTESSDLTPASEKSWEDIVEEESGGDHAKFLELLPPVGTFVYVSIEDGSEPIDETGVIESINPGYGPSPEFTIRLRNGNPVNVMLWEMYPSQDPRIDEEALSHRMQANEIARDRSINAHERIAKLMKLTGITSHWGDGDEHTDPATGAFYYYRIVAMENPRNGEKLLIPHATHSPHRQPDPDETMFTLLYAERERVAMQANTLSEWAQDHGYAMDDEFEAARAQNSWEMLNKLGTFLGEDANAFRTAGRNR